MLPKVAENSVRFGDVARGHGVEGRQAADDVGYSPTAADHRGRHCQRELDLSSTGVWPDSALIQ